VREGLPKQGQVVPEAGSWTGEADILRRDCSGQADGGRIRASVVVTDETEYVSAPDRTQGIVWFPAGEKHWHGATATTAMTHIAIQEYLDGKPVDWLKHVSDEQYLA
jgi:hypothetical protein